MTYAATEGVSAERSADHIIVLDQQGEVLRTLNAVGALVWEQLPATIDDLVDHVAQQYPAVGRERLAADVGRFLDELVAKGLVEELDAPS
ncbi:MAG: PqqD family protein [Actinomycetota bacterium]